MIFYILGIISLLCFILLVIKYPLRKLGITKLNAKLMKTHEVASAGVFLIGIVQIFCSFFINCEVGTLACIFGILAYFSDIVIIVACHMTKDVSRKIRDHRILSLIATVLTLVHVVLVLSN